MVTEFTNGGNLRTLLKKEGGFSQERALFYAAELVIVLDYIHNNDYVARDFNTDKILITEDGHIRLNKVTQNEEENNNQFERDFYNLGFIVYEFLTGEEHPFKHLADPQTESYNANVMGLLLDGKVQ